MKNKKLIGCIMLMAFIFSCLFMMNQQNIYAGETGTRKTIDSSDETLKGDTYLDSKPFVYDGVSVIVVHIDAIAFEEEDIDTDMVTYNEDVGVDMNMSMAICDEGSFQTDEWNTITKNCSTFIFDSSKLEKGVTYALYLELYGEYTQYSVQYSIESYVGYASGISFSSASQTLTMGESKTVTCSATPTGSYASVVYSSSDTSIATVDQHGKVSAKAKGTCTITAKSDDGKKASYQLTVNNPAPYLKYTSKSIAVNQSFTNQLCYKTNSVKWSSSNKKIATVSKSGKVKGKKLGSCTIYAKSGGKTYKCKIKVIRLKPNYAAEVWTYSTKSNVFTVYVKNKGTKSLTIYSDKAKAFDCDYKTYNRNLKLKSGKSVTIKPGKSKYVKFKVKGKKTWPVADDYSIRYYMKYDGKKYKAYAYGQNSGDGWESSMYYNKKWLDTYYDSYYDYFESFFGT